MASDALSANDPGDEFELSVGALARGDAAEFAATDGFCDISVEAGEAAARRKLSFTDAPAHHALTTLAGDDGNRVGGTPADTMTGEAAVTPLATTPAARLNALHREDTRGLRQGLSSIFEHVDSLLREVERAKAGLAQRTASLAAEREAHHDVKSRHRILSMEHERVNSDMRALQTELARQSEHASEVENAVSSLQQALVAKSRALVDHARRADSDHDKQSALQDDIRQARAELAAADNRVFSLESELTGARDALTVAEALSSERDAEIHDLRLLAKKQAHAADEANALLGSSQARLHDVESALDSERAELVQLHANLLQETDGRRAELASMQLKSDSLAARAEAQERQHAEARAELDGSMKANQLVETLLRDQATIAARAQDELQTAETRVEQLTHQIRDLEGINRALSEHTEGLTQSMRAREREGSNWKQKIDAANERLRLETQRFEVDRDSLAHSVARLTAQLDQEKLARAMAEGALDAARKERQAQARNLPHVRLVSSQPEHALTGTHGPVTS